MKTVPQSRVEIMFRFGQLEQRSEDGLAHLRPILASMMLSPRYGETPIGYLTHALSMPFR